jgi:hypothetical protein
MKELTDIHADRFYTELVSNGMLLEERVNASNEDGDFKLFFGFEDASYEAEEEEYTLEEYGEAYYFKDGKVYMVTVHLETNEASGVNELEHAEIAALIQELIENSSDGEEYFYQENEWAQAYR